MSRFETLFILSKEFSIHNGKSTLIRLEVYWGAHISQTWFVDDVFDKRETHMRFGEVK